MRILPLEMAFALLCIKYFLLFWQYISSCLSMRHFPIAFKINVTKLKVHVTSKLPEQVRKRGSFLCHNMLEVYVMGHLPALGGNKLVNLLVSSEHEALRLL